MSLLIWPATIFISKEVSLLIGPDTTFLKKRSVFATFIRKGNVLANRAGHYIY